MRQTQDQVLISVVVNIDQESPVTQIQEVDASGLGGVTGRAVRILNKQPVGKPAGLAQVHILQSIPVDIPDSQTLVPV